MADNAASKRPGDAVDLNEEASPREKKMRASINDVVAAFGACSLLGLGGSVETSLGLVNVTEAAGLGSDLGAYRLGDAFTKGKFGLPKDPVQARFWLKKVVNGECEIKHLNKEWIAKSAEMLRELDD